MKTESKYLTLNERQWIKGLVITVVMTIATGLYDMVKLGHFPSTWAQISPLIMTGLSTALGYFIVSLGSNSNGQILKTESGKFLFNSSPKIPIIIGFMLLTSFGFAQVTDSLKYWNMGKSAADAIGGTNQYYVIIATAAPFVFGWIWHVKHLKKKLKK